MSDFLERKITLRYNTGSRNTFLLFQTLTLKYRIRLSYLLGSISLNRFPCSSVYNYGTVHRKYGPNDGTYALVNNVRFYILHGM